MEKKSINVFKYIIIFFRYINIVESIVEKKRGKHKQREKRGLEKVTTYIELERKKVSKYSFNKYIKFLFFLLN